MKNNIFFVGQCGKRKVEQNFKFFRTIHCCTPNPYFSRSIPTQRFLIKLNLNEAPKLYAVLKVYLVDHSPFIFQLWASWIFDLSKHCSLSLPNKIIFISLPNKNSTASSHCKGDASICGSGILFKNAVLHEYLSSITSKCSHFTFLEMALNVVPNIRTRVRLKCSWIQIKISMELNILDNPHWKLKL